MITQETAQTKESSGSFAFSKETNAYLSTHSAVSTPHTHEYPHLMAAEMTPYLKSSGLVE